MEETPDGDKWLCPDCAGHTHMCLICNHVGDDVGPSAKMATADPNAVQKCGVKKCGRFYHKRCRPPSLPPPVPVLFCSCAKRVLFRCRLLTCSPHPPPQAPVQWAAVVFLMLAFVWCVFRGWGGGKQLPRTLHLDQLVLRQAHLPLPPALLRGLWRWTRGRRTAGVQPLPRRVPRSVQASRGTTAEQDGHPVPRPCGRRPLCGGA
jgi:hypothetical protein